MVKLAITQLNDIQLGLRLSSLLGELNSFKSLSEQLALTQPELLNAMQARAKIGAVEAMGEPFDYNKALELCHSKEALSSKKIRDLHGALHSKAGHFRAMKIKTISPLPKANPTEIESSLEQACQAYALGLEKQIDPLILVPLLLRDIFIIFPFMDGNKRLALLLIRSLLGKQHPVVECQYLEHNVNATQAAMYRALDQSIINTTNVDAWIMYWWLLLSHLYQPFMDELDKSSKTGKKRQKGKILRQFILQNLPCTSAEIHRAFPTISKEMIRVVLRQLRDEGKIKASGRGRGASWVQIKPL